MFSLNSDVIETSSKVNLFLFFFFFFFIEWNPKECETKVSWRATKSDKIRICFSFSFGLRLREKGWTCGFLMKFSLWTLLGGLPQKLEIEKDNEVDKVVKLISVASIFQRNLSTFFLISHLNLSNVTKKERKKKKEKDCFDLRFSSKLFTFHLTWRKHEEFVLIYAKKWKKWEKIKNLSVFLFARSSFKIVNLSYK